MAFFVSGFFFRTSRIFFAVVISGNARFTVLTPQLIRMEYSNTAQFEDRATLAFLNRNVPVPEFTNSISGGAVSL